jgi:alpha-L-fucosidase
MHTTWLIFALLLAASQAAAEPGNQPDRVEWFRDQGFGMFIHWSVDSQLGTVISHSMVGATDDYVHRFITELPKTFNPRKFHPEDWAVLAKLAGMRYVVFTAKHHSGFAMFPTATTDFGIMNTAFHRDITGEVLAAFREQGIAPGLYFSPDDFWWLYKNGKTIQRHVPGVEPVNNPGLLRHDQAQVRELFTKYGPIDVVFFDGAPEGLRELAWQLQPRTVVTRGALQTPEQYIPGVPLEGAWEACITMGTAWQYQPQNETYKSGGQLISMLIETRAKGGNLLLNVGPKPDGELPIEQESRLREVANWMFVNGESIYAVRPWVITNEGEYWFTKKKDENTLYVFAKTAKPWERGAWNDLVLHSVRATPNTKVTILSQNDHVLEYKPEVIPQTTFHQASDGLHIRAMHTLRLQDNSKWPNPVVLKLTNVQTALTPPRIETTSGTWNRAMGTATLEGTILNVGNAEGMEVGFEYRPIRGGDVNERNQPWTPSSFERRTTIGPYSATITGLKPTEAYEYRAVARHPLLSIYGAEKQLAAK